MTITPRNSRSAFIVLLNIMTMCALFPNVSAQPSLIELIEQKKRSIVTIQAQTINTEVQNSLRGVNDIPVLEKIGAGIIIDPAGYIVTNTHTILYAQFIFVTLHDGTLLPAVIASIAPGTDFTILKVEPSAPLRPLTWSDASTISLGSEVISIGNSALWDQTICAGRVTGIANKLSEKTVALIEMDLDLDRGDSGGPILDRQGNFLGIIIAKNTRTSRSSYAIPSSDIRNYFMNYLKQGHPSHE
jgi:S1-C subfamily serine protease